MEVFEGPERDPEGNKHRENILAEEVLFIVPEPE